MFLTVHHSVELFHLPTLMHNTKELYIKVGKWNNSIINYVALYTLLGRYAV